ncbi:MAG: glutamine synthetase III [Chitinophagales bacterium]
MRFEAVRQAYNRPPISVSLPSDKVSDYFASNVFTIEAMRKYLSTVTFDHIFKSTQEGLKIDREIANQVALAMKTWAIEKGATSYCHWFQPLTGATAEKHDAFFSPIEAHRGIETFSGKALIQQGPDGANFPSGGLRATFEARGYTAWDPSSPAFIMTVGSGKTLCIPTIFVAYTGESLDYKAPLLKSLAFLEQAALDVCHLFNKSVKKVSTNLGWEQEYYLVDAALYNARPDLMATGRTLLGRRSPRDKQRSNHYFGAIAERVYAYMIDFEAEAYKLGIPISTRHNEASPSQFECAVNFTFANVAADQNQLLMDVMARVARRHHLQVLFHEKPYIGMNGSGKHLNWSVHTDTGLNLFSPARTPKTNLQFLAFFINVIKAVNDNPDLLRAAIANAGNEDRLGVHEAPPAIPSMFIGSTLQNILNDFEKRVKIGGMDEYAKEDFKVDIHKQIPDLLIDNTDKNRTAPFAYTGNKFELRIVGASANCARPTTILNTLLGNQLRNFLKDVGHLMTNEKEKKDGAILRVLRRYVSQSKRILFEGDTYSKEWIKEAAKRGLSNVSTTPHALDFFRTAKAEKVLVSNKIYTKRELQARYEVWQGIYKNKLYVESRTISEMIQNQIIPISVKYQNVLLQNVKMGIDVGLDKTHFQESLRVIEQISLHIAALAKAQQALVKSYQEADSKEGIAAQAKAYCELVKPHFETMRKQSGKLELLVADEYWALPKYRELLFMR